MYHYGDWAYKCWLYNQNGGTHGRIDVTEAIKVSCNYFFYDIGRRTGISTIARYASAFGLGEPTGIEIPEKIGVMTTPDYVNSLDGHYWTDGQTLTAAIGQSYSLFTPLQLANYVATLAGGGTRYNAHLLKEVRTYDSAELVDVYGEPPAEIIDIEPENLQAVLQGMRDLVVSGSVAYYFKDCVVDAAAKTGTAQTGGKVSNGVRALRRSADRAGGGDRKGRQRRRAGFDRGADPQRLLHLGGRGEGGRGRKYAHPVKDGSGLP